MPRSTSCSAPRAPTTRSPARSVDDTLQQLYGLLKFGPTEANTTPARIVFVKSDEAKAKLGPALSEGNYKKTMAAPCVAIIGYDMRFFDKLPVLFPHTDAKPWFEHRDEANLAWVAMRNSSLQTAYLILAARALGLDCGPMTGFDNAKVDEAFFAGTPIRPTSWSTWVMAIPPASSRVRRASASTKPAASSDSHHPFRRLPCSRNCCSPPPSSPPAPMPSLPVTYKLDPTHTNVLASWNHFGYSNP
jgi:nitroreductase